MASPAGDLGERQASTVDPNVLDRSLEAPAPNGKKDWHVEIPLLNALALMREVL